MNILLLVINIFRPSIFCSPIIFAQYIPPFSLAGSYPHASPYLYPPHTGGLMMITPSSFDICESRHIHLPFSAPHHHHHHYSLGASEHAGQPDKEPVANAPLGKFTSSYFFPNTVCLRTQSKLLKCTDFSSPPSSRGVESSGGRTNGDFSSQQSSPSLRSDTSSSPVYQVSHHNIFATSDHALCFLDTLPSTF